MIRRLATAGIAAAAVLSLVACSSDNKSSIPIPTTAPASGDTSGGAVTIPSGATLPNVPGVSKECMEFANAMSAAAIAFSGQGDTAQAKAALQALQNAVPDDLKDDAATFANAYSTFLDIMAKYNGDYQKAMTDPQAAAALQALDSDAVKQAADNITNYVDSVCPSS